MILSAEEAVGKQDLPYMAKSLQLFEKQKLAVYQESSFCWVWARHIQASNFSI